MTREALRLAELIQSRYGNDINDEAAAELRRLYTLNQELLDSFDEILAVKFSNWSDGEMREIARAAIAKAEGEKK